MSHCCTNSIPTIRERLIQNHQIIINTQQNKTEREMRVEYINEE